MTPHPTSTAEMISMLDDQGMTVREASRTIGIHHSTFQRRLRKAMYVPPLYHKRRIDCAGYEECLATAARKNAHVMPCKYCKSYKPVLRDYMEDLNGCARLLQALFPECFKEAGYEQG